MEIFGREPPNKSFIITQINCIGGHIYRLEWVFIGFLIREINILVSADGFHTVFVSQVHVEYFLLLKTDLSRGLILLLEVPEEYISLKMNNDLVIIETYILRFSRNDN